MVQNRRFLLGLTLFFIFLSGLSSASITVSVGTDKSTYNRGETVTITAQVIVEDEGGCCDLNSSSMKIGSTTYPLPVEYGQYENYNNSGIDVTLEESHPDDCNAYGGNNTYSYTIELSTVGWSTGSYTVTLTANSCGSEKSGQSTFSVTAPSASTTTTISTGGGGGGGGGGSTYVAKPKKTCFDGIKNCHDGKCEEDVDCGGPCDPCISCSDGIQNQGEEGVDCGGPCSPCPTTTVQTTTTVKTESTETTVSQAKPVTTSVVTTVETTIASTIVPITTTTVLPPSGQGIPLGLGEGIIMLTAITLIVIAFMIHTGRI